MVGNIQTLSGHAIPPAEGHSPEHAVTIHLPKWQAALDFIDRKPELMQSFKNMYPRMMLHPSVKKLSGIVNEKYGKPGWTCLLFTNAVAPGECLKFATAPARGPLAISPDEMYSRTIDVQYRFWAVFFPLPRTPSVMPYWLNAGIGISSRLAEATIEQIHLLREASEDPMPQIQGSPAHDRVRDRVAGLLNRAVDHQLISADDVYLYQSGIAAIYQVYKYLQLNQGPEPEETVLFGFAFFATAYTLNDYGPSYKFVNSADCDELEAYLAKEESEGRRIRALFTEFPANPLLFTPDVRRLRTLADRYKFILIVDDTVGSFCNVDLMGPHGADVLITSLTKSFNGYSDVMVGSATLNPCTARYAELKALFGAVYQNEFFAGDAEVLERNSRDYMARSAVLNANAQALVDLFGACVEDPASSVLRVHHPSTNASRRNYEACMRPQTPDFTPGFGGLFTVEFDTTDATRAFYDALAEGIHIGPHLGAHVTIGLVYVKLLYGKELDVVARSGLNERQVRISAGLEPIDDLLPVFCAALAVADAQKAAALLLPSLDIKQPVSETVEILPEETA